jgi:hypothetical protein
MQLLKTISVYFGETTDNGIHIMSVNIPLNRHPIGFPDLKRKMDSQVIHNRNERLTHLDPAYTPLYELSNTCLSNGYIVIYGIESIPNESARQGIFRLKKLNKNVK